MASVNLDIHTAVLVINSSSETSFGFSSVAKAVEVFEQQVSIQDSKRIVGLVSELLTDGVTYEDVTYQVFNAEDFEETFLDD